MEIKSITSYNSTNQISHKGKISTINRINPMSVYIYKYLNRSAQNSQKNIEILSERLIGKVKTVNYKRISGWDINPSGSKQYVLFLHGMSQNVSNYQPLYESIMAQNKGVFALEYRGYGVNTPTHVSEEKLRKDVITAYNYLVKEKGINPEDIVVAGHSMGGVLASYLGSKRHDLKSIILISPLTQVSYYGSKFMSHKSIGVGVPEWAKKITTKIKPLNWLLNLNFNSINKIRKIKTPIYIMNSENDTVSVIGGATKLAQEAEKQGILKDFFILPFGGHRVNDDKIKMVSKILDDIYQ